jgi:hypothetical protein
MPSSIPQLAGPPGPFAEHVPSVFPVATLQVPEQQSAPVAQESPGCTQNDDAWHVPLAAQLREQHWAAVVHPLPSVLHVVLSGVHLPPAPHVWLQHAPFDPHGWLSEAHPG